MFVDYHDGGEGEYALQLVGGGTDDTQQPQSPGNSGGAASSNSNGAGGGPPRQYFKLGGRQKVPRRDKNGQDVEVGQILTIVSGCIRVCRTCHWRQAVSLRFRSAYVAAASIHDRTRFSHRLHVPPPPPTHLPTHLPAPRQACTVDPTSGQCSSLAPNDVSYLGTAAPPPAVAVHQRVLVLILDAPACGMPAPASGRPLLCGLPAFVFEFVLRAMSSEP